MKKALYHPHPHDNHEPSSAAGYDKDGNDLPTAAALTDILEDPNTKWSDIRAALKAGSYVDREGTKIIGATTNVGVLSSLMMPRRGRIRGGGYPSEDDKRTSSSHCEENPEGWGGEDDIKSPGEGEDANSSFEMALAASMPDRKGRRVSRRSSASSGASFKSKLKCVVEDAEDYVNDNIITRLNGYANDNSNGKSVSDLGGSINIMDFGVDWSPASSALSLERSRFAMSVNSTTSSCVDSDGFLPWGVHRRGDNASTSTPANSDASTSSSASSSSSVDSREFLDWGESARESGSGNSPANLDGVCTPIDNGGNEKESDERDGDVSNGSARGESGETWRIEDYEGSNDYVKRPGSRHIAFAKTRLAFLKPGAKSQRPNLADAPRDEFIKKILLKQGRRSMANEAALSSATDRARDFASDASDSNRQKSAFAPLFRKFRKDSPVTMSHELDDGYYSGRSIRLNREDDVDIGELRRELKLAMRDLNKSPV